MNTLLSAFFMVAPLNAPSVEILALKCDLSRFPTAAECRYWVGRADEHLVWVNDRIRLTPLGRESWVQYRQQVIEWRSVWQELQTARTLPTVPGDRGRLDFVKTAVGEENYRRGFVYPPIASYLMAKDCPGK